MVAEMIREQVLRVTRDELPFSTAVLIDKFQEPTDEDHMTRIWATILVERDSQKPIVIGRGGEMIKEIGTAARHEIETFLQNTGVSRSARRRRRAVARRRADAGRAGPQKQSD